VRDLADRDDRTYPGDPENIEAVYRSISSFF